MLKNRFLFIILCCVTCSVTHAQDERKTIAELQQILKNSSRNFDQASAKLDLALGYVLKPGELANDLDSAELLIRQSEALNAKTINSKALTAKSYFVYSNLYREKGDKPKGKEYCEKAITIYKTFSASDACGETYMEYANYYNWSDSKETKLKKDCFSNALAQFKLTGNKLRQGFALKNMADLDDAMRNFGQALVELHEALDIYNSISYPQLQGVYDLLGLVSNELGDFASAVKYGLLAVKTCEAVKDTSLQFCTICFRLGLSYDNWDRNNGLEAVKYFRKAFDVALKYNDEQSIFLTLTSLCNSLCKHERCKESVALLLKNKDRIHADGKADSVFIQSYYLLIYLTAGEKQLAKASADILVKFLPIVDVGPQDQSAELGYRALVTYFLAIHQPALAVKYANLNLVNSKLYAKNKALYLTAFRFKATADSAAGDFASAFKNWHIFSDLKDSLFTEQKSFQFTQMQAAFELEKKESELNILQSKDALNNAALQRSRLIRNIIIAASFILLLLLYTGYIFKQRNNKRLQKKQAEINDQNEVLKNTIAEKNSLLTEKEWLVKEIHHRVKNNLQIVISLLNTQSHYVNNEEAMTAISESRHRMEAISLIHQKLYQAENNTTINAKTYINELVEYLEASFVTGNKINFKLAVEPLEIDIAQAIPLGLILNEIITNSIKYAFANKADGCIQIALNKKTDDEILLQIKDNGIGWPDNFDVTKSNTMGMRLIAGLIKQIDGKLEIFNEQGAVTAINFKQQFTIAEL